MHKSFTITLLFVATCFHLTSCATYLMAEVPSNEPHNPISIKLKESIISALWPHSTRGLYIAPNIPLKKLEAARKVCVTPPNEEIIALIDSTVMGSAKRCLLIGSSGVFFRNDSTGINPGRWYLPYSKFHDAIIEKKGWYDVSIGGPSFNMAGSPLSKPKIINILLDIQLCVRQESGTTTQQKVNEPMRSLSNTIPIYPEKLKKSKTKGRATIAFIVDREGVVRRVTIKSATHRAFGKAAKEAIISTKFEPAKRNGIPIESRGIQTFEFTPN